MKKDLGAMATLLWKDILLELRTKDIVISVFFFAILVIVIFNFALDPAPRMVALVAPGILWIAVTFGGILGITRSFSSEKDQGNLQGILLAPVGREVVFFGKMLGIFIFMLIVEVFVFPIFVVLFNLSTSISGLIPVALLATLGYATVGTLFSAMALNTRSREVMLPLLLLPVALPLIIAAVEASGEIFGSHNGNGLIQWVLLLVVFDAIFLVVCPFAFNFVVDE